MGGCDGRWGSSEGWKIERHVAESAIMRCLEMSGGVGTDPCVGSVKCTTGSFAASLARGEFRAKLRG